ncbi:hypothetical protein [Streptosporangium sp. KLBMP 9127]|nr:hypothetical protein [Streptosporangium sp. KLBMP 9127]
MRLTVRPLLLALAIGLLTAQPAAAQSLDTDVPFAADSGDSCRRGSTEGVLTWVDGPVIRPTVRVRGHLRDEGEFSPCALDRLFSLATYSAYAGGILVDSEQHKVDNGRIDLAFTLSGVGGIDRVTVSVCRQTSSSPGIGYCGKLQEYKRP